MKAFYTYILILHLFIWAKKNTQNKEFLNLILERERERARKDFLVSESKWHQPQAEWWVWAEACSTQPSPFDWRRPNEPFK